jgi:hypothetical protein
MSRPKEGAQCCYARALKNRPELIRLKKALVLALSADKPRFRFGGLVIGQMLVHHSHAVRASE